MVKLHFSKSLFESAFSVPFNTVKKYLEARILATKATAQVSTSELSITDGHIYVLLNRFQFLRAINFINKFNVLDVSFLALENASWDN